MDTIRFDRHPATITLGDGLGIAATYLRETWAWWLAPVVGLAIFDGLLTGWTTTTALGTDWRSLSRAEALSDIATRIVPMFGFGGLLAIIGVIVSWFYAALAIHGLRGRPITVEWVLSAGVKSLAGLILIGLAGVALWGLYTVLVVATHGFALIALIGIVPLAIYAWIRIYFWTLAIFDGAGVVESFRVAWELSRGGVLRMLGWALMFAVLSILIGIAAAIVRLPLVFVPAISAFVGQAVSGVVGVFTLYGAAVLYESQRWRNMAPARSQPPYPGYPGYPGFAGGPAPGGYPGAPQAGYPPMGSPGDAGPWGAPSVFAATASAGVPPAAAGFGSTPSAAGYGPTPGSAGVPPAAAGFGPTPGSAGVPPAAAGFGPTPGSEAPPPPPGASAGAASGSPSGPGLPPPLVPWAPIQPPPPWSPPPASGWVPAPQSGWATPTTPAAAPPVAATSQAATPVAPPPLDASAARSAAVEPAPPADDSPTEPYPPPA